MKLQTLQEYLSNSSLELKNLYVMLFDFVFYVPYALILLFIVKIQTRDCFYCTLYLWKQYVFHLYLRGSGNLLALLQLRYPLF